MTQSERHAPAGSLPVISAAADSPAPPAAEAGGSGETAAPPGEAGEERGGLRRRRRERRRSRADRPAAVVSERPAEPAGGERAAAAEPAVELTLDLRWVPSKHVLARLTVALEKVSDDVTMVVLLPDLPEYVPVMPQVFQTLRARGYATDTARLPGGIQRLQAVPRRQRAAVPARPRPAESTAAAAPAGLVGSAAPAETTKPGK